MSRAPVAVHCRAHRNRKWMGFWGGALHYDYGTEYSIFVDSCSLWTVCAALLPYTNSRLPLHMAKSSRRLLWPPLLT